MKPLILITNDDGIHSPGLAAAAAALDPLGDLLIIAPHLQQSGMGRSMPGSNDGRLMAAELNGVHGHSWQGYAAHASPAQAVQYGVLEVAERRPSLVVSGINYGENVGMAVTISGTVGAALEGAALGIRSLAVSLEVDPSFHLTNDDSVDFSAALHFTRYFAERLLRADDLPDVDVLKLDIPARATPESEWRITRLERQSYYRPVAPTRDRLEDEGPMGYEIVPHDALHPGSDASAIVEGIVSVTPLSLDMTSRISADDLRSLLDG